MFEKLRQSKLLFWSVEALILLVLFVELFNVSFIFAPIVTFFSTLLIPILVAGFLYYLFNPLVKQLEKVHVPRKWGILLVFVVVFGALSLILAAMIPNLVAQMTALVSGLPDIVATAREVVEKAAKYQWYKQFRVQELLNSIKINPSAILKNLLGDFSEGLPGLIGSVAGIVINLITIPVMLFYMLKDGHKLVPSIQRMFPERYADEVQTVFSRMGETVQHYIAGQALECLFVGTFTFIGYWLIGMPYALLLGFISGVVTIIPYLGPYIGIAPALIVAAPQGLGKLAMVVIVTLVVQQTDGNLIYPNVIGRSLDIHPLTIIVLLLVVGNLFGILGTILAVPVYAVCKTVISYGYELYRFHKQTQVPKLPNPPADE